MTHPYVLVIATFLAFASIVGAQTVESGGSREDRPPATASHAEAKKLFSPFPVTHYSVGDVWTHFVQDTASYWAPLSLLYTGIIFVPPTWWLLAHRFADAHGHPFAWGQSRWV